MMILEDERVGVKPLNYSTIVRHLKLVKEVGQAVGTGLAWTIHLCRDRLAADGRI